MKYYNAVKYIEKCRKDKRKLEFPRYFESHLQDRGLDKNFVRDTLKNGEVKAIIEQERNGEIRYKVHFKLNNNKDLSIIVKIYLNRDKLRLITIFPEDSKRREND